MRQMQLLRRGEANSGARDGAAPISLSEGHWSVRPVSAKGSHQLVGASRANCLVVLDDGEGAAPGDAVTVMLLAGWEPDPVLAELTDDRHLS